MKTYEDIKFVVYATGRDCDGLYSDEEYFFDSKHEADSFAYDCNKGSDGLKYEVLPIHEYYSM